MITFQILKVVIIAFLLFVLQATASAEEQDLSPVYLYGVEFTRSSTELKIAQETYAAIQKAIGTRKLIVKNASAVELDEALKQKKADIVITNSGIYRRHLLNGWRDVVTLATLLQPNPDQAVGSLILANKNLGIKTIEQLKGHTIALNWPAAFQGTLTIKKELLDQGYDPETFFSKIAYLGTDALARLDAVRRGEVDSTFLSVCYAERYKIKAGIDLTGEFQVVGAKLDAPTLCASSTSLYPNYSILVSSSLDSGTIRKIAENLLKIKKNTEGEYWTFSSDYESVDKLYEGLKEGPYLHLKSWTLLRIWQEFKVEILLLALSIVFVVWHIYSTGKVVRKATAEFIQATGELKRRSAEMHSVREALVVSSLSSVIAHELAQPVAACLFYGNSLSKILRNNIAVKKDISVQTVDALMENLNRASEILGVVRSYASKRKKKKEFIYINDSIKSVVKDFVQAVPASSEMFRVNLCGEDFLAGFSRPEFEIIINNLLKNSFQAIEFNKNPEIYIQTKNMGSEGFEICITDNSGKLTDEALKDLELPLTSKKEDGMGLGISIVKSIARRYGFVVKFSRSPENNMICLIRIFADNDAGSLNG